MTTKNFVVKNGITTGSITLDASTGNITGTNLSVTGVSRLGAIGNVKITGGSSGQTITTDGTGNLTFTAAGGFGNLVAPMPTYIATANSYLVSENFQGLFTYPITVDGDFVIDGVLAQVDAIYNASNTQVIFTDGSNYVGNTNFTFNKNTGTMTVPSITTTGVVKTTATTYSSLPIAATAGAGARSFITDANTTTFLATVAGGGSNAVPVVSNGTVWIVG